MNKKVKIENIALENIGIKGHSGEWLLKDVNVQFDRKKIIQIKSATGGGRTTLLRMLAGLATPQEGKVILNDKSVYDMGFEEFIPYRLNIGFSFDMGGLINNKTLHENLLLPCEYHPQFVKFDAEEKVTDLMKYFGFYKSRDLRPFSAPGSHRKLTVITRAFVMDPGMVLLDEPFQGLPKELVRKIKRYIQNHKSEHLRNMFIAANDDLKDIVDEVYIIKDQKLEKIENKKKVAA